MRLRHRLEAWALRGLVAVLRALGPVRASDAAGRAARAVGPWLPVSRVADLNLRMALPELDAGARRGVVRAMWESLGRTLGELPHLGALREGAAEGPGWVVEGAEVVDGVSAVGGPAILFGGHIGNWEMMPVAAARHGVDIAGFYRPAENRAVDAVVAGLRQEAMGVEARLFPKGAAGARQALRHLGQGGVLGMLVDQKMNDGVEARLFGRPTMTASALAVLALRLRCPVIPAYVRRVGPARFRVVCEAPLALPATGDRAADVLALTQAVNDRLEAWIRAEPSCWLWVHRRWAKALYR